MNTLMVELLVEGATYPTRAHPDDAGLDLYVCEDVVLDTNTTTMVRTGISIHLDPKHVGMICDRSSLGKIGIKVMGGIIDSGYTGEVMIALNNTSAVPYTLKRGMRAAQLLVFPISVPEVIKHVNTVKTERGAKGFGSSGQ